MNNFDIFNLNDLKKALKKIKLLFADNNFNENTLIKINLHIQYINPIGPFYFYTLDENIKSNINEEDYNGMLYTIKIILIEFYKLIKERLTINLICNPIITTTNTNFQQISLETNEIILAKIIRFILMIKELQQELQIKYDKLFLQINEPYNISSLKKIVSLFANENFTGLEITGGLILQTAIIPQLVTIIKEGYFDKLLATKTFRKLNYISINFMKYNNYKNFDKYHLLKHKAAIILTKEKNQLLSLFNMIKNLINKYPNIIKFDIYFGKYHLISNHNDLLKTLNILPNEYYNLQQIYNRLIQDSILTNIKNKLEKYLCKIYGLTYSINNLRQIMTQEKVVNDGFLKIKLQKDLHKIEAITKEIIGKFINYQKILQQTNEPEIFDYLNKFDQLNRKLNITPEYLELKHKIHELFDVSVNSLENLNKRHNTVSVNSLKNLNKCHNNLEDNLPGIIIEYSEDNKILLFSAITNDNYNNKDSYRLKGFLDNKTFQPSTKLSLTF